MNTPRLFARPQTEARGWNSELALRYGAATLVTLIALAAAQLVVPTQFVLALGAVTLAGVPVALWMRLHDMRIGGVAVPRPLWNALTVLASGAASLLFLRVELTNIVAALQGGMDDSSLLRMGATDPMLLLVKLFLVFAAFRSFSIISDKDATLATVPSFSVLLLLIPIYPQIEVVCYFLVWTMVATMLFALDHRSEIHAQVTAAVPAPAPGQEVRLAARSLVGVLGVSLDGCHRAVGIVDGARSAREFVLGFGDFPAGLASDAVHAATKLLGQQRPRTADRFFREHFVAHARRIMEDLREHGARRAAQSALLEIVHALGLQRFGLDAKQWRHGIGRKHALSAAAVAAFAPEQ